MQFLKQENLQTDYCSRGVFTNIFGEIKGHLTPDEFVLVMGDSLKLFIENKDWTATDLKKIGFIKINDVLLVIEAMYPALYRKDFYYAVAQLNQSSVKEHKLDSFYSISLCLLHIMTVFDTALKLKDGGGKKVLTQLATLSSLTDTYVLSDRNPEGSVMDFINNLQQDLLRK